MTPLTHLRGRERGRAPWTVLGALVVIAGGLTAAWLLSRHPATPRPGASGAPTPVADTSDAIIGQALRDAPIDSTEIKHRWQDEIPGLDVAMLTPAQQQLLVRVANSEMCTCGCGFTLAACRAYDTTCPVSGPRMEALRDSVHAGQIRTRGWRARPGSGAATRS